MSLERVHRMRPWLLGAACVACIATASAALLAQSKPDAAGQPPAKKPEQAGSEKADDPKAEQKDAPAAKTPLKDKKADSQDPGPRRNISPEELLKELQKDTLKTGRPITSADKPGEERRSTVATNAATGGVRPVSKRLLPDGSRIVDRPGRLTREGSFFTFSFESRGQGAPEMPIRLLPNRLLEDMEIVSAGGAKSIVFVVSGEVTEYRGVNYLLVQMLLVRPDLGNLK